jgi:hypothetical protein
VQVVRVLLKSSSCCCDDHLATDFEWTFKLIILLKYLDIKIIHSSLVSVDWSSAIIVSPDYCAGKSATEFVVCLPSGMQEVESLLCFDMSKRLAFLI